MNDAPSRNLQEKIGPVVALDVSYCDVLQFAIIQSQN